jgi:hypothetical protein
LYVDYERFENFISKRDSELNKPDLPEGYIQKIYLSEIRLRDVIRQKMQTIPRDFTRWEVSILKQSSELIARGEGYLKVEESMKQLEKNLREKVIEIHKKLPKDQRMSPPSRIYRPPAITTTSLSLTEIVGTLEQTLEQTGLPPCPVNPPPQPSASEEDSRYCSTCGTHISVQTESLPYHSSTSPSATVGTPTPQSV